MNAPARPPAGHASAAGGPAPQRHADGQATPSKGPLDGIVVLDITRALTGPFCTMILGDLGADVIKVEIPGRGDEARHWGPPFIAGSGPNYLGYNRNKRSVAIDLHTAEGQAAIRALAAQVDVVVENFRPGTMRRFGLGDDVLKASNPDLIYCAISGYGPTGPLANWPAMDLMIQAVSGIMSLTGEPEGRPHKAAAPITDLFAGFAAALSVLAAIHERGRSGQGRSIDISMLDCALMILGQSVTAWGMNGRNPPRSGNAHPLMAPYQSFRTRTREFVCAITTDKRWNLLCTLPEFAAFRGRPELATQALRNANAKALCAELQEVFETNTAEYWLDHMFRLQLPAAPVNTVADIAAHEHVARSQALLDIEYPAGSGNTLKTPGVPWRDVAAPGPVASPPTLGQHTREVFEAYGIPLPDPATENAR
ncbi:CaiB/BaiF CoA-transferase family protein [Pigmentiphaga soli]|uniref:CaiB/BaiF CoA-transferase family protein n=1 Tax=Pigmentiphaga soli TaxID=1007095 RepID=A0ABP8HHC2_9BURK